MYLDVVDNSLNFGGTSTAVTSFTIGTYVYVPETTNEYVSQVVLHGIQLRGRQHRLAVQFSSASRYWRFPSGQSLVFCFNSLKYSTFLFWTLDPDRKGLWMASCRIHLRFDHRNSQHVLRWNFGGNGNPGRMDCLRIERMVFKHYYFQLIFIKLISMENYKFFWNSKSFIVSPSFWAVPGQLFQRRWYTVCNSGTSRCRPNRLPECLRAALELLSGLKTDKGKILPKEKVISKKSLFPNFINSLNSFKLPI